MEYMVWEYEADGHQSPPDVLHASLHETLDSARAEVRRLLGVSRLTNGRKWRGSDTSVEAYHMFPAGHPRAYGCGGYAISLRGRTK